MLGYGDSGSGPEPPPADSFVAAPIDESAARLAAILREEAADVLTIYDPLGGYGHPDHVRVHDVGRAAAELAGTPVVLEATISRDLLALAAQVVPTLGLRPACRRRAAGPVDRVHGGDRHHAHGRRRRAPRRQAGVDGGPRQPDDTGGTTVRTLAVFLALPEDLFAAAFGTEWFVDRACAARAAP